MIEKYKKYIIEYEIKEPEKDNYLYKKVNKIIYYNIKKNTKDKYEKYWSTGGCIEYKGKEIIEKIIKPYIKNETIQLKLDI